MVTTRCASGLQLKPTCGHQNLWFNKSQAQHDPSTITNMLHLHWVLYQVLLAIEAITKRWSAIGFSEKFSKFIRKHLWWSEKFSKCIRKHLPWSTFYLSCRFWFATLMKKVLHWKGELLQILRSFWVGILKNTSRSLQALLFYSNTNYFKNLIPYGFQALTKQHSYIKLHKKKILF